jgi:hypothetical protein
MYKIKELSILKHKDIPYTEYQVIQLEEVIIIQDIYSGKTIQLNKEQLNKDYYYIYQPKHKIQQD